MRRLCIMMTMSLLLTLPAAAGWACVGKTLQVGVVTGGEEKLLSKMLSILVNERTGTSIKMREFASFKECFTALQKNEIDVVIAFTGQGYAEVAQRSQAPSADMVLAEDRQVFNERYNLVWLEPWGYTDGGQFVKDPSGQPIKTQVAPLVRKETLKEFPALARLINKMAGKLDDTMVDGLMKKAGLGDTDRAARDFLKAEKLI